MLDDIKSEVIEPAEAPDCNEEQKDDFDLRMLSQKHTGGQQPDDQKQNALEFYPARIGDVFHKEKKAVLGESLLITWSGRLVKNIRHIPLTDRLVGCG